ncbi:MAG: hypothetical protein AAGA54_05265 [Myxococcota bacterium]
MLATRVLIASVLVTGTLIGSCQCSRGPVTETETVLVEARSEAATATIVYDYFHGRRKAYDSPVWNKDPTTQETVTLFVTTPGSDTPKRLKMREQSNKSDDAPNAALEAKLALGPDGKRVAYKLSDGGWELVFVTSSHYLFQAESGALEGAPDWAVVPTFEQALPSLLRAHGEANGIYEEVNRGRIFGHLAQTLEEPAYVEVLAQLGALRVPLYGRWSRATNSLSPAGTAALGRKLRAALEADPSLYLLRRALPFLDLDDPDLAELIHTAPAVLSNEQEHRLWTRDARNGYLEASAKLDPERARATACALIKQGVEASTLPEALRTDCDSAQTD